jgi:hypothetical protein
MLGTSEARLSETSLDLLVHALPIVGQVDRLDAALGRVLAPGIKLAVWDGHGEAPDRADVLVIPAEREVYEARRAGVGRDGHMTTSSALPVRIMAGDAADEAMAIGPSLGPHAHPRVANPLWCPRCQALITSAN